MKKSVQWDIVGIFALILGLIGTFSFFFFGNIELTRNEFTINMVIVGLGNPVLIALFFAFCLLSFAFGFYEGIQEKKLEKGDKRENGI